MQQSELKWAEFIAEMAVLDSSTIVWIDETGCDRRNALRKYGYGIRGQTPQDYQLKLREVRYSAISPLHGRHQRCLHNRGNSRVWPIVGRTNIRTLVSDEIKGICLSILRQFVDLSASYVQPRNEQTAIIRVGAAIKQSSRPKTATFRQYDRFSDSACQAARERRRTIIFGILAPLTVTSQTSKNRPLLRFDDHAPCRHLQVIKWSQFGHMNLQIFKLH